MLPAASPTGSLHRKQEVIKVRASTPWQKKRPCQSTKTWWASGCTKSMRIDPYFFISVRWYNVVQWSECQTSPGKIPLKLLSEREFGFLQMDYAAAFSIFSKLYTTSTLFHCQTRTLHTYIQLLEGSVGRKALYNFNQNHNNHNRVW